MSEQTPPRVALEERPEKDHIRGAAAEVHAENLDLSEARPAHPERELWYCLPASIWDAHRAEKLFREYDIDRVYDLGAGDCRFSLWLERRGYDAVAYELTSELVAAVRDRFHFGDLELRERDYYALVASDAAVVAFGGTNELPHPPEQGLGIEGYAETGITAWHAGDVVGRW